MAGYAQMEGHRILRKGSTPLTQASTQFYRKIKSLGPSWAEHAQMEGHRVFKMGSTPTNR